MKNPQIIVTKTNGASTYEECMEFTDTKIAKSIAELINTHSVDSVAVVENEAVIESPKYAVSVDLSKVGGWNIIIGTQSINDKVFDDCLVGYTYEDRTNLMENIEGFACEASGNDKVLMKADIKYLESLDDNYVFSSISTNEYISPIEDVEEFNEVCSEILTANAKL